MRMVEKQTPPRRAVYALVSVTMAVMVFIYLVLYPNLTAALLPSHVLGLVAFMLMGGGLLALGVGMMRAPARVDAVLSHVKALPRLLVWPIALLFTLPMLQAANVLQRQFNVLTLIPLYAVVLLTALGLIAWREWGERGVLPLDVGRDSRGALRLALMFALVSFAANIIIMDGFGISSGIDAPLYVLQGEYLFDQSYMKIGLGWQGLPYRVMNYLTRTSESPVALLLLHAGLMAAAVAAVVYLTSRRNLLLGVMVGVFLSLDPTWLAANRGIQTEGPTMALALICLTVVVSHVTQAKTMSKISLLLVGCFYAAAISIRVYNLVFLGVFIAVYWLYLRPRMHTLYLAVGMALVLLFTLMFNLWRYQAFSFSVINSFNYDAALFVVGLYDPANGPVSTEYQTKLQTCFPDIDAYNGDFVAYLAAQEGAYPYYVIRYSPPAADCMQTTAETMSALMREMTRAKPLQYITTLFEQNSAAFALAFDPILIIPNALIGFDNHIVRSGIRCDWCDALGRTPRKMQLQDTLFQWFVRKFTLVRQPYLLLPVEANIPQYMGNLPVQSPANLSVSNYEQWYYQDTDYCTTGESCISLAVIVAWFLWAGFVFITTRGALRLLVLLAFLFIHLQVGLVTVGFMFDARYALAYTPLMLLIGVVGWVTIGAGVWQLFTPKKGQQA